MFKFVQGLLILTSADGAHKPAVRDDATYRSVFPSKSAYPKEVSHFDSPMSVGDMKVGVTAHDEGKKEDDFSLGMAKEDEEGLRDASAATMAPETASTTVGIDPSGDINGPEMVGNPSQFFSLSEVVLEGHSTFPACPETRPKCLYSKHFKACKCYTAVRAGTGLHEDKLLSAKDGKCGQASMDGNGCRYDHFDSQRSDPTSWSVKPDRGKAHVGGPQSSMSGSIVTKAQASTPTGLRHFQQPQTSLSGPPPATPGTESRATPGTESLKTYLDRQGAAHQKSPGSSPSTSATSHSPRPLKDFVNDQSSPPVSQSLKDYLAKQGAAHQKSPRSGGSNRRTLSTVLAQQTPSAGKGVGFDINGVSTESPDSPWH